MTDVVMWEEHKQFAPRVRQRQVFTASGRPFKRGRRRSVLRIAAPARRRRRNLRTAGYLGIELKFLDCAWNGVAIAESTDGAGAELQPSSGCTDAISIPAQGDGEQQRDGRKFTMRSAFFNGVIDSVPVSNQADVLDGFGYYFAMVLDTQTNATTIASEDVYINPGTSARSIIPKPLRNLQNSKRFRILDSMYVEVGGMYAMTDGASTGSLGPQAAPTITLSWSGDIPVNCVATTASVAASSDNSIHIVAYASSTALTPTFQGKSRVRFVG